MTIILLLVGLGLLILGADRLIKGASDIATVLARKSGAPEADKRGKQRRTNCPLLFCLLPWDSQD